MQQLTYLSEPLLNYMLFCLVVCSELWENCDLYLKNILVILNHFSSEGDRNVKYNIFLSNWQVLLLLLLFITYCF